MEQEVNMHRNRSDYVRGEMWKWVISGDPFLDH